MMIILLATMLESKIKDINSTQDQILTRSHSPTDANETSEHQSTEVVPLAKHQ